MTAASTEVPTQSEVTSRRVWSYARATSSVFQGAVGSILIAFIVVVVVGEVLVGRQFSSAGNLSIIATSTAVPLLLGTASSFALLSGVVDLSIGSNAGLSAGVFTLLTLQHWNSWLAAGIVLLMGAAVGLINAVVVVRLGANTIAATLGMLTLLGALLYVVVGPSGSVTHLVKGLYTFVNQPLGSVTVIFVIILGLLAAAVYVATRSRFGRHCKAVGGDETAARRAGISVQRVRTATFLLSGVGAAVGGLLYAGQQGGATDSLGANLPFQVYAALMIGGYSIIRGGIGNPVGGALGIFVVAGVTDIIALKAFNTYYTDVLVGLLLIIAVLIDRARGGEVFE